MTLLKHSIALITFAVAGAASAADPATQPRMDMSMPGMAMPGMKMDAAKPTEADSATLTRGIVKKVDTDQGKITIQHEALENLGMPAMTMVFRAADATVLQGAKAGEAVAFRAEKVNGALVVTRLVAQ
ncbi:copper-binding protein [Piscinibacter koreensis]|uniref:Copper-binding protein n=1 Tax=Piscinibacter koreensis TaxID=2742824 RepID=A0A7Y6NSC7_9BURK|nr:copper-binding protein [Schlegelella koreensis]NUZ08441.1 copper-binding protein [Schlegelella koreensis]